MPRALSGRPLLRLTLTIAVAALPLAGLVLVARRLSSSSWPLEHADPRLAALAGAGFLGAFLLRSIAWSEVLGPGRRDQGPVAASIGAGAATGQVLPFRLDLAVKVATLRRLADRRPTLEAIGVSLLALGILDTVALLPLSATAAVTTDSVALRVPLCAVAFAGAGACALVLARGRLLSTRALEGHDRIRALCERATAGIACPRAAARGWVVLALSWGMNALGAALLLQALGAGFAFEHAVSLLVLSSAVAALPFTSLGASANAGAAAAALGALGVERDVALNFGLASSLLLVVAALAATAIGATAALAPRLRR